jgi:hypothetical protein
MLPFSIFESMPAEIPAAAPRSATVKSIDLRNRRTSKPMLASSVRAESSLGAAEPVRSSVSASAFARRGGRPGTRCPIAPRGLGLDRSAMVFARKSEEVAGPTLRDFPARR